MQQQEAIMPQNDDSVQHRNAKSYEPEMHEDPTAYDCLSTSIPMAAAELALNKYYYSTGKSRPPKYTGRVLDLACGSGAVTQILCERLNKDAIVDGCDMSAKVLEYASQRYKHLGLNLFKMDVTDTCPRDLRCAYDLIFSNFMMHWVRDHRLALSNIREMLKPNGHCVLSFFANHQVWTTYRVMSRRPRWSKHMDDVENFISIYQDDMIADETLRSLMVEVGFSEVDVELRAVNFSTQGIDYLAHKTLIGSVDPFVPRIPAQEREDYMDEFMEVYTEMGGLVDFDAANYDGAAVTSHGKLLIAIATK